MTNDILQDLITRLQTAVQTLTDTITTLTNQNAIAHQKIADLESDIQKLQLEKHTLQTQLDDAQQHPHTLQHIQDDLNTIITDVEKLHQTLTENT